MWLALVKGDYRLDSARWILDYSHLLVELDFASQVLVIRAAEARVLQLPRQDQAVLIEEWVAAGGHGSVQGAFRGGHGGRGVVVVRRGNRRQTLRQL